MPIPSVGSRIGSSALFSSPSASVHVSFTLVDAFLSAPGYRLAARTIAAGSFVSAPLAERAAALARAHRRRARPPAPPPAPPPPR